MEMGEVHRYVITNVPTAREKETVEILCQLFRKGIIQMGNIHQMTEEPLEDEPKNE